MAGKNENLHSLGAAVVAITVFVLCLYIVIPIAESALNWFGFYFVSNRYGGGSEIHNVGLIQMVFRAVTSLVVSGFAGLMAGNHLFPEQNPAKTIAISITTILLVGIGGAVVIPLYAKKQAAAKSNQHAAAYQAPPVQLPMSAASSGPSFFNELVQESCESVLLNLQRAKSAVELYYKNTGTTPNALGDTGFAPTGGVKTSYMKFGYNSKYLGPSVFLVSRHTICDNQYSVLLPDQTIRQEPVRWSENNDSTYKNTPSGAPVKAPQIETVEIYDVFLKQVDTDMYKDLKSGAIVKTFACVHPGGPASMTWTAPYNMEVVNGGKISWDGGIIECIATGVYL